MKFESLFCYGSTVAYKFHYYKVFFRLREKGRLQIIGRFANHRHKCKPKLRNSRKTSEMLKKFIQKHSSQNPNKELVKIEPVDAFFSTRHGGYDGCLKCEGEQELGF